MFFVQTYKDYEVVILDNGSTDGTDRMIKEGNYPVRCFWQENQGEPSARNKLLDLAQGEYLTGTLCRKTILEQAGGFDVSLPVCSTYALWLKLCLQYEFIAAARPTKEVISSRRALKRLSQE